LGVKKSLIDKYRLRFPDDLEQDFREDYFRKSLNQLRFGIILGTAIYALFGILDAWITPEVKAQTWFIRYAVVVPACISVFVFSFSPYFKKYMQITMFVLVLVAGGGIVALIVAVQSPVNNVHFAGLLLFLMYSYTLSKLRFVSMCVASWTIVGAYEISALAIIHTPVRIFLTDNIFYIAANLFGMFSSYNREIYMRRDFFHNRMIQELEEKKHHVEKEQLHEAVQKATKSLRESEGRFRALAETTTAAIFIHQGERILYANPAGELMSGYTSEELLQRDFWTFIHPEYQELVRERGRARVRGEAVPKEYEFKFIKKNGDECWVTTATGFIEYSGKPAIIATLFDITDRKRAEEEKVKLYEERIEEEKRHLMEKEKILMDLHDGIGGITTNISILSELGQKAKDIKSIKNTLATISRLSREGVSEIRSFMQGLDSKELSWNALAAELRKQGSGMLDPHSIRVAVETSVADVTEQPGSLLWVNLFRVYKEALTNVIKHSNAGSVAVTLDVTGKGLLLIIQDDGIGWEENGDRGRGLWNMKRRTEAVGGRVAISSEKGTRVSLEIPLPLKYPIRGME
jgi:PAS domain S-box-containing protein